MLGGGDTVDKAMHALVTRIQQKDEYINWAKSTIVPIYKGKEN